MIPEDKDLRKFILARWAYAISEEYMDSSVYNGLEKTMKQKYPDNPYCNRPWSDDPCPVDLLREEGLANWIRQIKMTHNSESIDSIRTEEEYEMQFKSLSEESRASYKIDGWNDQVDYYNGHYVSANTRGRATNSIEVAVMRHIVPAEIPFKGKVKFVGELSIPSDKWKIYKELRGCTDQRASVSTAVANGDWEYLEILVFDIITEEDIVGDKYEVIKKCGFKTPMSFKVSNFQQLDKAITMLGRRRDSYNYLTDGVVIENSHTQLAVRIREWKEMPVGSYVLGYPESPTAYGFSMSVAIKPTKVGDKTISSLSLTNAQLIVENNLKIGYPISFVIRSGADPVFDEFKTRELQEIWEGRYEEYRKNCDGVK